MLANVTNKANCWANGRHTSRHCPHQIINELKHPLLFRWSYRTTGIRRVAQTPSLSYPLLPIFPFPHAHGAKRGGTKKHVWPQRQSIVSRAVNWLRVCYRSFVFCDRRVLDLRKNNQPQIRNSAIAPRYSILRTEVPGPLFCAPLN